MLWSTYYISVLFNKEIFNNYLFEGKKTSFAKNNFPNHNSFKIYVSGELIKKKLVEQWNPKKQMWALCQIQPIRSNARTL